MCAVNKHRVVFLSCQGVDAEAKYASLFTSSNYLASRQGTYTSKIVCVRDHGLAYQGVGECLSRYTEREHGTASSYATMSVCTVPVCMRVTVYTLPLYRGC